MSNTLWKTVPDAAGAAAITQLAARIESTDGAPPLSDQALTCLTTPDVAHLRAYGPDDQLTGYAQRDGDRVEIAADPDAIDPLLSAAGTAPVRIWTHGRRSRLVEPLERHGFRRARELCQLRRPLDGKHPLPADPALPDGVTVRAFVTGADDEAWLDLNAAAFADHPEQGGWTEADLRARIAADWFEPEGFLLAERAGQLLGFHWTKVHPDRLGEVYVLGVAPAAQGLGLGRALLVRGLRRLRHRGCPTVLLYVEADNDSARRLYARADFADHDLDVQWSR